MEPNIKEDKKGVSIDQTKLSIRVSITAITAALYIALGYIFQPISFFELQFRVAELVVGMCILFPWDGLAGKVIGVFFVNLTSPLGPIDLLSTIINIPALYCIVLFRNRKILKYLGGIMYSIIIALYVALVLNFTFGLFIWLVFAQVLISEVILSSLGILLFDIIRTRMQL
jgi:hypothetical protein